MDDNSSQDTYYCSNCELDELKKEAEEFCPECDEYFCKTCALHHMRRKLTMRHKALKLDDLKTMPISLLSVKTVCEEHYEILEHYCPKHELPFCDLCASKHMDCGEINSLSQFQGDDSSVFFDDVENSLQNMERSIETLITGKSTMVSKMNEQASEYRKQIHAVRLEINDHLDKLEKELDNEVENAFLQPVADIESSVKVLKDNDKQIVEWKRKVSDVIRCRDKASDVQLFLITQDFKKTIGKEEVYVKSVNNHNKYQEVCVSFAKPIEQFLNGLVSSFGKLDHRTTAEKLIVNNKVPDQVQIPSPSSKIQFADHSLESTPTRSSEFTPRRSSESTPNTTAKWDVTIKLRERLDLDLAHISGDMKIFGCSATPDGNILLGDKRNQRIVLLHSDGSLQGLIRLKYKPNNIAYADGKIFYTSYSGKCVGKVDMATKQQEKEAIFNTACEALALSEHNVIVHLTEVEYRILDYNLHTVTKIPIKNKNCPYLSFCKGNIYFAYWKENTVFCCDMSGKILWKVKDRNLLSPTGVTTDSDGNVYVSGFESNNVMRISNDGKRKDLIDLKYSLRAPYSIFYNRDTNRLLVTTKDTTKILEFDIICSVN